MATPMTFTKRRQPVSTASGHKVYVKFQSLSGTVWSDVAGLAHVPVTFRTMRPYEQIITAQLYPNIRSWAYMRWRPGLNIQGVVMRMVYGNHIYRIHGVGNYDEANTDIILYLEEWHPTGTVRS